MALPSPLFFVSGMGDIAGEVYSSRFTVLHRFAAPLILAQ
jgi:hypothetical protein